MTVTLTIPVQENLVELLRALGSLERVTAAALRPLRVRLLPGEN